MIIFEISNERYDFHRFPDLLNGTLLIEQLNSTSVSNSTATGKQKAVPESRDGSPNLFSQNQNVSGTSRLRVLI